MAHFQNQYGAVQKTSGGYEDPNRQVDAYGNPVVKSTDEYGNPVHHTGGGGFDSAGYGAAPAAGTGIGGGHHGHGLHRSGSSSSSSSSEDDGQGGRRKKKGLKGKIKEKLPLGHKDERPSSAAATTTPGGYSVTGKEQMRHHEKKGMMEKIKDNLPGHRH